MSIKPLNPHYAMENPASVYDEEALTALELAGRTTGKVNEVVKKVNEFTGDMTKKHDKLVESVPGIVSDAVQEHVNNGTFDDQVDRHYGNLKARVDNLVVNGEENLAEVVDIRVGAQGFKFDNAGNAVREQFQQAIMGASGHLKFYQGSIDSDTGAFYQVPTNRVVSNMFDTSKMDMVIATTGKVFKVFGYDNTGGYNGSSEWVKKYQFNDPEFCDSYARIVVRREDDENVSPNDPLINFYNYQVYGSGCIKPVYITTFTQGTVTTDGELVHRDNRLVSPLMVAPLTICPHFNNGWFALLACYDDELNFLGCTDFTQDPTQARETPKDTVYVRIVLRMVNNLVIDPSWVDDKTLLALFDTSTLDYMLEGWDKDAPAFIHETMNIAYSDVNLAPINTTLHYKCAAHMGFNALKGDVRKTANGVLIMSHDAGFTRAEEGSDELTTYNKDNCTLWSDYEWREVEGLHYWDRDSERMCYVPTLAGYLRVCRATNKIAYITLRNEDIGEVVEGVINTVKEHGMLDRCVINSYTYRTLENVRKHSRTIPVSLVLEKGVALTMNHIAKAKNLGNGIITLFYYPDGDTTGLSLLKNSETLIKTAHHNGIKVHMAQLNNTTDYERCIQFGITGAHLTRCILPHTPKMYTFEVEVSQGTCNVGGNWNLQDITTETIGYVVGQGLYDVKITNTVLNQLLAKNMKFIGIHNSTGLLADAHYHNGYIRINTAGEEDWYQVIIIV